MESGNDFVIQLKGNCPLLKEQTIDYTRDEKPNSTHKTIDKARGRIDIREYKTYCLQGCKLGNNWEHINAITIVKRYGTRDQKNYEHYAYYLSNILMHAKQMGKGIRGHWSIENNLHRVKDVTQKEDQNYIKEKRLARNVSMLQTLSMSLIRLYDKSSVKFANEKYANNIKK